MNPTKDGGVNNLLLMPLNEHTYRHPSSCPALCHASQEDADGFTLDPALSPLFQQLSSLPFCVHLSAICSILLTSSLPCYLACSFIPPFYLLSPAYGPRFTVRICREALKKPLFSERGDLHLLIQPVHLLLKNESLTILWVFLSLREEVLCGTLPTPGGSPLSLHLTGMITPPV